MTQTLIEMTDALLGYRGHAVLHVDHLAVRSGRCLGVLGPNGSGKTTLLRTLAGLLDPLSGSVLREGTPRIGYLPQLRSIDPAWPMNAFDAAALAASSLSILGWLGGRRSAIRNRMTQMSVDHLAHRSFNRLSGGQQQRVLLAGILAIEPRVLLLDEPTEGLDQQSRDGLLKALDELKRTGLAIVLITHDAEDLTGLADDVAHLHPAPVDGQPSSLHLATKRVEVVQ